MGPRAGAVHWPCGPGTTRPGSATSATTEFVADPVGTVESVYARFGLPLTGAAADAMRALHAERARPRRRGRAHRYTLADFGLTAGQVDERFAAYLDGK